MPLPGKTWQVPCFGSLLLVPLKLLLISLLSKSTTQCRNIKEV